MKSERVTVGSAAGTKTALPGHALRAARPCLWEAKRHRSTRLHSQRGSITIWGIGLTLVIAAFAGLVIDTWRVFAERQDLSGMADSAAIAGATAVDINHLDETGEVILDLAGAELRALEYLQRQDGWAPDITFSIVTAADGSELTVALEKDVDFSLLGPLLPAEDPLRIAVTARASPHVVAP